ncbi:MAG: hypothetical protein F4Z03_02330 [Gemmatimonadetes bacterium]|nr:hypothetical protein [Gemmatimonadota bacterium]
MSQNPVEIDRAEIDGAGPDQADATQEIEPSILTALPHYLPLGVFPLILLAALWGGWWLLPPMVFMSLSWSFDRVFGRDGRIMDPWKTPKHRLIWHNLPVWSWAFLWQPTLVFGLWQILVVDSFVWWQDVVLAIILTMEAQAVFVVGHELIHRRTTWERRIGEFLLSSASYPQYATEHVYIHHALVGTPYDVGSAPKGESFWRYMPKEIVSNLVNSWEVARERLARRRRTMWHYSNPFWRYGFGVAFWYALVYWMGGIWAVPVFAFLGLSCVFSMKISNYFQHYGLRRVRLENGRWEKIMPRHSWSADWKFSNWMLFNAQRHADHHAVASRQYPLLQVSLDESPELPGTYSDMMNIVLKPKKWFEKMDPLVDQWRKHFYPEIDDWSVYDSPIAAKRPDAFDTIVEIFGAAPRLAKWIERNPELLDNLQEQEFLDLDLPKGFEQDEEFESIARRGLARVYWTYEMGVQEMKDLIVELPVVDARETAEIVRNWSNDKAFQIGMHVVRGNLLPAEARTALSNLSEASVSTVLASVVADFGERYGTDSVGEVAAVFLGDLASREAYPGIAVDLLFVHDGAQSGANERLFRSFRKALGDLAQDNLLFSPVSVGAEAMPAVPLSELADQARDPASGGAVPVLTRARCVFEPEGSDIGSRFEEERRRVLAECGADAAVFPRPGGPPEERGKMDAQPDVRTETSVSAYAQMSGGLNEVEQASRFLQLTRAGDFLDDPAPSAAAVFEAAGDETLAQAANQWRDLQGVMRLVGEDGFDATTAGAKVKALVANACGQEDFDALVSTVDETASRAASRIDTLTAHA